MPLVAEAHDHSEAVRSGLAKCGKCAAWSQANRTRPENRFVRVDTGEVRFACLIPLDPKLAECAIGARLDYIVQTQGGKLGRIVQIHDGEGPCDADCEKDVYAPTGRVLKTAGLNVEGDL